MGVTVTELQRIPTSAARAVEPFEVGGMQLLAVPQLALDQPGEPAAMNGGDSNTELLLLRRTGDGYRPFATLPAPGGEDAEFFTVGGRHFLAVASIRSGSGPYEYRTDSCIFEWTHTGFTPFQRVPTYAAKQWTHWTHSGRHFLGLAQGVQLPHLAGPNRDSMIFEWDGSGFAQFQPIPSRWAYNWHALDVGGEAFLAHADHLDGSRLFRWDGERYVFFQPLLERAGRAFASFRRDGDHYLLVAGLEDPPVLMRWDGERFAPYQDLDGLGARELEVVEWEGQLLVVRVNFILGTPAAPEPALTSQVYQWQSGKLEVVATFPTSGGTDAAAVVHDGAVQLLVSNSLTAGVRFATDTVLYALSPAASIQPGRR